MESRHYDGPERRGQERRTIWLRRLLVGWIVLFTPVVMYSLRDSRNATNSANRNAEDVKQLITENRHRIAELEQSKAQVTALQSTNCGLAVFLLTARKARWDSYTKTGNKDDLRAVLGYERLAAPFLASKGAIGKCPIPARVKIKSRPLDKGDR